MAQWSTAASLDRWIGPRRCGSPPPPQPWQAPVPTVPPPRPAKWKGRIGCASVPRELSAAAEAEQTARPLVDGDTEEEGVVCEACSGAGWLLCDFCKGKKNNVKSEGTRVYRRCPTCKAAGFILCPRCRVYKCITFPESNES
ncbi:hypothetical protein SETIT_6G211300v2 [Setaria italica]|uniref:Uncharacterized protein n=1 Tax=Setaria italica TaxID=4555 RepID=K3YK45_SETIT|nr:protein PHOTOSYSTEM I ASSEMBLY 2, chloroplastic [Setaria italica]RCV31855.1 hypothetical protein SETIT_6G211300v2 [Setaria italica]